MHAGAAMIWISGILMSCFIEFQLVIIEFQLVTLLTICICYVIRFLMSVLSSSSGALQVGSLPYQVTTSADGKKHIQWI